MASSRDVTALLGEWSRGNHDALNELLPLVYAELRRVAARQLRTERVEHTLQPTALVHEVYLRLVDQRHLDWQNRAHFFGVAAQVMRRILVDHARRRACHRQTRRHLGSRLRAVRDAGGQAAFPPGGAGVTEGGSALLAAGLGIGANIGLTLALVRRARALVWAVAGLAVLGTSGLRVSRRRPQPALGGPLGLA